MFVTILVFVLILSVLVLVHEFGHFITAKKLGIKVEEFGIGFPPRVFGKKIGETVYSVNLLPIGGFVKLYGEDNAGGGSIKKTTAAVQADLERAFFARPLWQRMLVVTAGVVMNFILAVVIISYLFASQGVSVPTENVVVTDVLKNSPAALAGLQKDDRILSINGIKLTETEVFIRVAQSNKGKEVVLQVDRAGKVSSVTVVPRINYPKGEGPIGVGISNIEIKKYTWYEAPFYGTVEALKFTWLILQGLGTMVGDLVFRGIKPEGVAGPIGVAQLTGQAVSVGFAAVLWFTALLSLNLAVLNILPIPALDGGRFFFMVIELVTRRKVSQRYESLAHAVGLVMLLSLMVVITLLDISRVVQGKSILP